MRLQYCRTSIAIVLSTFLTACGSGGSFETDPVTVINEKPKSLEQLQKERDESFAQSEPRSEEELDALTQPANGYAMAGVRLERWNLRNRATSNLSPQNLKAISTTDVSDPNGPWPADNTFHYDVRLNAGASNEDKELFDSILHLVNQETKEANASNYASSDGYEMAVLNDFKHIKAGYLYRSFTEGIKNHSVNGQNRRIWMNGPHIIAYYLGENPSSAIPTENKTFTYVGEWLFISNSSKDKSMENEVFADHVKSGTDRASGIGNYTSGLMFSSGKEARTDTQAAYLLASRFDVNFADKTVKGKLNYAQKRSGQSTFEPEVLVYEIDANMKGSRFIGTAKANRDINNPLSTWADSDSSSVEGGFYGDKAQELAGKFLTDKNTLFAVFGAKREEEVSETVRKLFDAYQIDSSNAKAVALDNYGNAMYLYYKGKTLPLLNKDKLAAAWKAFSGDENGSVSEGTHSKVIKAVANNQEITVCCSNLNYVRFGRMYDKGQDTLFLQGERSESVPTAGTAKYAGTWQGSFTNTITLEQEASMQVGKGEAKFDVDFGNKTLAGELFQEDDYLVAINLKGGIEGNGFKDVKASVAKEGGIVLDKGNQNQLYKVDFKDVPVTGGFYGPNALELGGQFSHDGGSDGKASVVFGARQQKAE
ncbi:hypothetical protein A4G20_04250 [Pasteurellaceae bacterium RH1A]|nr:hypothetical protein A4G20_04250 [Pasteurellaceae bacterium RH1A]